MALTKITRGVIKANENYDTHNINSTGIVTAVSANFTGNVSIGGTLTYQDVTNIDSVGVITARNGIDVTGGSVGIGTDNPQTKLEILHIASRRHQFSYDDSLLTIKGANSSGNPETLRFIGGDSLRFNTGSTGSGTERLRIKSDGKIGIGTDNPSNFLHVKNYTNASNYITAENTTAGNAGVRLKNSQGDYAIFANDDLIFYDLENDVERLRIESGGFVGLGTDNAYHELHIQGSGDTRALITSGGTGDAVMMFENASGNTWGHGIDLTNNNYVIAYNNTSDPSLTADGILNITSDGKVGVGCDAEVDFQVRNGNGGILKVGGSGNSATGFQIQYNNSGNTTTEILTNYRATSGNASLKLDTGTLKIATGTSGTDQLIIDSNGRILKGMSASLLGSSDVQLTGSGGPATIAGYKSDNNPTSNSSMLTVTGYSQSGSTFTGIGEIDFRVSQNSNTASGYHPGSIVTRVNGGSTTGTFSGGYAYSYAGLKDRERITFKSKRYYCLPEIASGSDTYNLFREEWDYQHPVGYNRYSWYRFTSHSSSSSRGGSVDIRVTWSTRHAGGNGYGHWGFHWRDSHANGYMEIGNVYKYHSSYLGGTYYGWSSNPNVHVYEINDSGNNAGFYLRVQGHIDANGSTYDGGVMHQFLISAHTNRLGADVNKFEFVGNSTPSDAGSQQGNVNLP